MLRSSHVAPVAPSPAPRESYSRPGNAAARTPALRPIPGRAERRAAQPEPGPLSARWTDEEEEAQRQVLQRRLKAYLRRGRARVIFTDNLHTMVSIKRGQGVLTFRIHRMFAEAPPMVLRAVARYAEDHDRDSATLVREYIEGNDHLIRRRGRPRTVDLDVEGRHHDLLEIFDDLNERYFDGAIQARITWGPRRGRKRSRDSIKLGSYTVEDALIRIHPVLDAADVPRFFIAWIVYHEMLHEVHDMPIIDGRRVYHTAEFRRAEARFEHYAEAILWERSNLHRLLER